VFAERKPGCEDPGLPDVETGRGAEDPRCDHRSPVTDHRAYDPALTTTLVDPLPEGPVAWITLTMITFVPVVE
jgi:hypothetical protein